MSRLKADEMFTNHICELDVQQSTGFPAEFQATQGNTALKVHHHSDSDYHTGVSFALSNGGVI